MDEAEIECQFAALRGAVDGIADFDIKDLRKDLEALKLEVERLKSGRIEVWGDDGERHSARLRQKTRPPTKDEIDRKDEEDRGKLVGYGNRAKNLISPGRYADLNDVGSMPYDSDLWWDDDDWSQWIVDGMPRDFRKDTE